jgi:CysZ protein
MMLTAFHRALTDAFAREQRRAIVVSLVLALIALLLLWLGATVLLHEAQFVGNRWFDTAIEVLGSLAALVLSWILFPATTMVVLGFFLDGVVAAVERRHYPELGPARRIGIAAAAGSALRLTFLAVVLNVVILPLYLVPVINLFIYYGLNGYLVGREYFELVALRRMDKEASRAMWRRHRGMLVSAGVVIAFLLSVPLFNLMAPVMAAAFMLHLVEGLRRHNA